MAIETYIARAHTAYTSLEGHAGPKVFSIYSKAVDQALDDLAGEIDYKIVEGYKARGAIAIMVSGGQITGAQRMNKDVSSVEEEEVI